jgi:hypothetical protein
MFARIETLVGSWSFSLMIILYLDLESEMEEGLPDFIGWASL